MAPLNPKMSSTHKAWEWPRSYYSELLRLTRCLFCMSLCAWFFQPSQILFFKLTWHQLIPQCLQHTKPGNGPRGCPKPTSNKKMRNLYVAISYSTLSLSNLEHLLARVFPDIQTPDFRSFGLVIWLMSEVIWPIFRILLQTFL